MRGRTRGMTLLETLIAGTLTTAVLAMTCEVFAAVNAASEASTRAMLATSRAAEVAANLAGQLRNASAATIVLPSAARVEFTPVTGYASGVAPGVVLGASVALALEPDGVLRRRTFAAPGVVASSLELARGLTAVSFTRLPDGRLVVAVSCAFESPQAGVAGTREAVVTVAPRNL